MASSRFRSFIFYVCLLSVSQVLCDDDVTLGSLVTMLQQQATTIQSLQARMTQMETSGREQSSDLTIVKARLNARVFFTADMSQGGVNIGTNNSPIKFDNLVTSDGSGSYNPQTSVFIAPLSGLYVFNAKIMSPNTHTTIHYGVDKAGKLLCINSAGEGNNLDKSSCLAAVHVQKGETVFVRRYELDSVINGWRWCSFSGFLVSAD